MGAAWLVEQYIDLKNTSYKHEDRHYVISCALHFARSKLACNASLYFFSKMSPKRGKRRLRKVEVYHGSID